MRLAKVVIAKPIITQFFTQGNGRAIEVTEGLPDGAEMISLKYDTQTGHHVAVFQHESFPEVKDGKIPHIKVLCTTHKLKEKENEIDRTSGIRSPGEKGGSIGRSGKAEEGKESGEAQGLTGRFFIDQHGRSIAVLAEVETYRWGRQLVVEETDRTGHTISVGAIPEGDLEEFGFTEIGKAEWLRNFDEPSCELCNKYFEEGEKAVPFNGKVYHSKCFAHMVKEMGHSDIAIAQ